MDAQYNIEVKDTVFDPNTPTNNPNTPRKVHVREQPGSSLYKVWLYLTGYDLPYIQQATYILHPTFPEPIRKVPRNLSNPNCQLVIWTWGLFEVKVTIEDKSNRTFELKHQLTYDKELTLPGIEYVYE